MRRSRAIPVVLLALFAGLGSVAPATGSEEGLLEALALVPDLPQTRTSIVSYLDQEAVAAARPGAARPGSMGELQSMLDAGDPAADLWLAAFRGVSSGDPDLLRKLGSAGSWPEMIGFDLLDVDRHLTFGQPPTDGSVLLGEWDADAVVLALGERGFTSSPVGDRTLICGAAGCDKGLETDFENLDPGLPFGGDLGRSEPLAVSGRDILSSADIEMVEAMLAASAGETASMADDPAIRAVATAGDPGTMLIQATVLPAGLQDLAVGVDANTPAGDPDATTEAMPMADAIAFLDAATESEQVVTIALAYAEEPDAAAAAEILVQRLATGRTSFDGASLQDLLDERGVDAVTATVRPAAEGTSAVARVELRAPLAGDGVDPGTGQPTASSAVYRLFTDLLMRRDAGWLLPAAAPA